MIVFHTVYDMYSLDMDDKLSLSYSPPLENEVLLPHRICANDEIAWLF